LWHWVEQSGGWSWFHVSLLLFYNQTFNTIPSL